jgi:lysophospholipase L1-like esterase
MSVLRRARTRLLVCCIAATAALALVFVPTAGAAKIGNTYLALGDSLAYGYHQAQFQSELGSKGFIEPATFNDGYVDDFAGVLKIFNPHLQLINDGCPGETTETLIKGSGVFGPAYCAGGPTGGPFPKAFLHHQYPGSQLEDALAILAENSNVSPITLNIGSNDVLQFLTHTCGFPAKYTCTESEVAAEFGHIVTNVGSILGQLRAAAPNAQIVLIGAYNPYPTLLPPPGGDKTLAALNGALKSVAASVPGTSFADSEPAFNIPGTHGDSEAADIPFICVLTAMCPGGKFNPASPVADIHPSKLGYAVMGGVVTLDFFTH